MTNIGRLSALVAVVMALAACSSNSDLPPPAQNDAADVTTLPDGASIDGGVDGGPTPPNLTSGPIDRAGRPLISLGLIAPGDRDTYNQEDPLTNPSKETDGAPRRAVVDMQSSLVKLDMLDGANDWNGGSADGTALPDGGVSYTHPLVAVLRDDVLLVDTSKPYSASSFFEIENERFGGPAHTSCGGLSPAEDVGDKMLSLLISKKTSGVQDNVPPPASPMLPSFPYLLP